jgi:predicted esterase YcpF (UPF0227 family)
MHILYLHGFRSGPQSTKAQLMRAACAQRGMPFDCPQLPVSPGQAAQLAHHRATQYLPAELTIVGSSLGGYYATWLAELVGCRAVLLNPAVNPARDLANYVTDGRGPLAHWHTQEPLEFHSRYLDELRELTVAVPTRRGRYLLVAATGDEVLDWREMSGHYRGCRQIILQGSNHAIDEFESLIPELFDFIHEPH